MKFVNLPNWKPDWIRFVWLYSILESGLLWIKYNKQQSKMSSFESLPKSFLRFDFRLKSVTWKNNAFEFVRIVSRSVSPD